jgi:hypothetical protein
LIELVRKKKACERRCLPRSGTLTAKAAVLVSKDLVSCFCEYVYCDVYPIFIIQKGPIKVNKSGNIGCISQWRELIVARVYSPSWFECFALTILSSLVVEYFLLFAVEAAV